MTVELTITARGQVTLRKAVLDHLGVRPGGRVRAELLPDGRVELKPPPGRHDISRLAGALHRPGQRPVTLDEMQEAIVAGAAS
jgi:bifunctional DNA-binding transcriptional regulator/antitoxin component of YhaV-PrlF toxin-antitoxin module